MEKSKIVGLMLPVWLGLGCGGPAPDAANVAVSTASVDPLYHHVVGKWEGHGGYYCGNDPCFNGDWWHCSNNRANLDGFAARLNNPDNLFYMAGPGELQFPDGNLVPFTYAMEFEGYCSRGCDNGNPGEPAFCRGQGGGR